MIDARPVNPEVCEERTRNFAHRINKVDERLEKLSDILSEVSQCNKSLKQLVEQQTMDIKSQDDRLACLEKKPSDRWNSTVSSLITAVIGGLVVLVFKYIFGG